MTAPSPDRPPTGSTSMHRDEHQPAEPEHPPESLPPFAPVFTLVDNTSTQTTHHPHVRYVFSDDDPDILTQALAACKPGEDGVASDPGSTERAIILDLDRDDQGKYSVAWASSLSPSWAVLDTQLSHISPPSSEGGGGNNDAERDRGDRLMLRIEGIESGAMGSSGDLGLSSDGSKPSSGSASGVGSTQKDRTRLETDTNDYSGLVNEFEKRMVTLRKVVEAGEERRRKVGVDMAAEETTGKAPEPSADSSTKDGKR